MQDNALSNINTNKLLQDKLNTQLASGKKINRPSDDPVIAIRALRLRSTLSEVTQYHEKNVEDAESWLKVTEDAINSVTEELTNMIEECNGGANEHLSTETRQTILESLNQLREGIYATGDADYAGRGVFTGYRTGTKLRFQEEEKLSYAITERVGKAALDDITYIKMDNGKYTIGEINEGNYYDADYAIKETEVSQETVHRLRLSYDDLDNAIPRISYYKDKAVGGSAMANIPVAVVSKYGKLITEADGSVPAAGADAADPYTYVQGIEDGGGNKIPAAVLIPETGELILNDMAYEALSSVRDYSDTRNVDEGEIIISYEKTHWSEGDLRPEHYFECVENCHDAPIKHNMDESANDQIISYDVGFNQEIRVNTLASEVYTHGIGRDVDDLVALLEQVNDVESTIKNLEDAITTLNNTNVPEGDTAAAADKEAKRTAAEASLAAANKAFTFLEEKLQVSFEHAITKMQTHLETATLAHTAVGTRGSKLELVKNRLSSQKSNFKDLVADNEQADTAEVTTDLYSAKLAYDASLMATGKIADKTLMNFI